MKIIDKSITTGGVEMQLEDWGDEIGFQIGAYPTAHNSYLFIKKGEPFRLTIANNKYIGYSNDDVRMDYEALKRGDKSLEDLSARFWNGRIDMELLGMI